MLLHDYIGEGQLKQKCV